ncbi:MAG TPA: LCP family protein, partial [Candidatus Limnocylindria bacterium]|nr:LCP family protein [Candidatus Limnocylindria bacterium]
MTQSPPTYRVARRPSAALAAALSFVLPGLGQAYAGRTRLGLLFAAPVLILAGMVLGAVLLGTDVILRTLVIPGALVAVLALDVGLMLWRLVSIGEAGLAQPRGRSPFTVALVAILMVATVAMHLWVANVTVAADRALAQVFDPPAGAGYTPPAFGHLDPDVPEYRWDGTERVNILLIGYDSGPGRVDENTDTLMVATIDPASRTAALISIPRDTGYVPLPDRRVYADGVYPRRVNELASAANADPALWCPDLAEGDDCGLATLRSAVGLYLGIEIHHVAWVDLMGFAALVDAVGGVELCLPGVLADPRYGGPTWEGRGIVLEGGCRVYDGPHALAFARIRQGTLTLPDGTVQEQNDFLRAARQQEFLLAFQQQVAKTNLLISFPSLLNAVSETVTTDFPRAQAGDLASLAPLITSDNIQRVVLGWPEYVDLPVDPLNYYLLIPRRDAVRDLMA